MIEILLLVLIFNAFPILLDISTENRHYLESYNKLKYKKTNYDIALSDLDYTVLKDDTVHKVDTILNKNTSNQNIDYKIKFKIDKNSNAKENFTFINYTASKLKNTTKEAKYATKSFIETNHLANWTALSKNLEHSAICNFDSLNKSIFIYCDKAYIKNLGSDLILASTGELIIENLNAKNVQIYSFDKVKILNSSLLSNTLIFSQLSDIEISSADPNGTDPSSADPKGIDLSCANQSYQLLGYSNKQECRANNNTEKESQYLLNFRPISAQLY